MSTFTYQIQRSSDGTSWVDIGTASGSFDPGAAPFSHEIDYIVQDADANDYLRAKITDSLGVVRYSPLVGPVGNTPPPSGLTFETSSSVLSRPAFTPIRNVTYHDFTTFKAAMADLRTGDYVKQASGSGRLFFSSNGNGNTYRLNGHHLSGPAVIDLGIPTDAPADSTSNPWMDSGALPDLRTGDYTSFAYQGGSAYLGKNWVPMVFDDNINVHLYGGEFNSGLYGAGGIRMFAPSSGCYILDSYVSQAAGSCIGISGGTISGGTGVKHDLLTVRLRADRYSMNPDTDNHADKGTGLHGCIVHEGGYTNMKICIDGYKPLQPGENPGNGKVYPEGGGASVIEIGQGVSGPYSNNHWWARGNKCHMKPGFGGGNPGSTGIQGIGGLIIANYGVQPLDGNVFEFLEGNDITGNIFNCGAGNWHNASPAIQVLHGRSHLTRQYPNYLSSANKVDWPSGFGIVYNDLVPY